VSGGRTGRRLSPRTRTVTFPGWDGAFRVSDAQAKLIERAAASTTRSVYVKGGEKRSAEKLALLAIGTLTDDGSPFPGWRNRDGERYLFKLAEGAILR
jgi:hypothetical protein